MACYRIRDYVLDYSVGGYRVVERDPTREEARRIYCEQYVSRDLPTQRKSHEVDITAIVEALLRAGGLCG